MRCSPLAFAQGWPEQAGTGGEVLAKSAPDGYTLLMSSGGMVSVNPHLYRKMALDPANDLVPVAAAARVTVYLMAKPSLPPAAGSSCWPWAA